MDRKSVVEMLREVRELLDIARKIRRLRGNMPLLLNNPELTVTAGRSCATMSCSAA